MTAHELAKKLLEGPDAEIEYALRTRTIDGGWQTVEDEPTSYPITQVARLTDLWTGKPLIGLR